MTDITIEQLAEMDRVPFEHILERSLHDVFEFQALFLHPTNLERTLEYLNEVKASIGRQIARYGGVNEDKDWRTRITTFSHIIDKRIALAERRDRLKDVRDGDARGPRQVEVSQWKRFAHKLIEAMIEDEVENDVFQALDDIEAPFGGLSARQWVARRIEKDPTRTGAAA